MMEPRSWFSNTITTTCATWGTRPGAAPTTAGNSPKATAATRTRAMRAAFRVSGIGTENRRGFERRGRRATAASRRAAPSAPPDGRLDRRPEPLAAAGTPQREVSAIGADEPRLLDQISTADREADGRADPA